jgi:hypothetical protein
MRYFLALSAILILCTCTKNKRIIQDIEGTWKLEDVLLNDGQHTYPNEIHIFAKGKPGGDSYATWTKYASDTVVGKYFVTKKGNYVVLRNESVTPVHADTCTVDDFDKKMLIIRSNLGVMYFYKQ